MANPTSVEVIDVSSMEEDKKLADITKELLKKKEIRLNEMLQHLKGNLVAKLGIYESYRSEVVKRSQFGHEEYSDTPSYTSYPQIHTGVFDGLELSNELTIKGDDHFKWNYMFASNGPEKDILTLVLLLNSKLLKAENGEVMLWNGKLPNYIYSGGVENYPRGRGEAHLFPKIGAELDSEVIIIGDNAVAKIFGLKPSKDGMSTEWIYSSLLKKQGLNPDKVLPHWAREESSSLDLDKRKFSDKLQKLEEKVKQFPEKFFKQYINALFQFDQYLKEVDAKRAQLR